MTVGVVTAASVPGAPLLLPEISPDGTGEADDPFVALRADVEAVLATLPPAGVVILLGPGERGIHDEAVASLRPLGIAAPEVRLPVAHDLIEHATRLTQYPMFRGRPLSVELTVLVRLLAAARPDAQVLAVSVPPRSEAGVLVSTGASLHEASEDAGLPVAVLAVGDLSACLHEGSPGYVVEGAGHWDAAVVEAFEQGRLGRVDELGPREAERVQAVGWAPLVALRGIVAAGRLRVTASAYHAPGGVGYLVAVCGSGQLPPSRFEVGHGRAGVLPRTGDPRAR